MKLPIFKSELPYRHSSCTCFQLLTFSCVTSSFPILLSRLSCFCLSIYWCLEYFLQYSVLVDYSFNIFCQFLHSFLYFIWIFFFFHRFLLAFCIWYLELYLVFFQKKGNCFIFFLPLVGLFRCHLLLGATHISVFPTLSVKLTLMGGWFSTCDAKIV